MSITYWPGGKHEAAAAELSGVLGVGVEYKDPGFIERYVGHEGDFHIAPGTKPGDIAHGMKRSGASNEDFVKVMALLHQGENGELQLDAKKVHEAFPKLYDTSAKPVDAPKAEQEVKPAVKPDVIKHEEKKKNTHHIKPRDEARNFGGIKASQADIESLMESSHAMTAAFDTLKNQTQVMNESYVDMEAKYGKLDRGLKGENPIIVKRDAPSKEKIEAGAKNSFVKQLHPSTLQHFRIHKSQKV